MHLMMLVMPFGGGLSTVFEPVAHAADSGKRGGPAKGKKGKGKGGDNDGVGPFKKNDYPMAERQRPLVLPKNMGEVVPSLGFNRFALGGDLDPIDVVPLGLAFNYGLANVVEFGVSTGITLSPEVAFSNNLTLQGHYLAYDSKLLDFAPGLVIPLNFGDAVGIGIAIDLSTRYLIPDSKFFVRFGDGAIPLGVSPDFTLGLNVNGGVGYQATKQFVGTLDLQPIAITLAPDANASGLWDYVSMTLGGQYTFTRNADAGLNLSYFNTWAGEDGYGLGITGYGRFRF